MSLKKYLLLMTIGTLLILAGLVLVLFFINPYEAGWRGLLFFYIAFFLFVLGISSISGFIVRFIFIKNEFAHQQVRVAFRQGLMLAGMLSVVAMLQAEGLLVWWNAFLLLALLGVIEYMFIFKDSQGN